MRTQTVQTYTRAYVCRNLRPDERVHWARVPHTHGQVRGALTQTPRHMHTSGCEHTHAAVYVQSRMQLSMEPRVSGRPWWRMGEMEGRVLLEAPNTHKDTFTHRHTDMGGVCTLPTRAAECHNAQGLPDPGLCGQSHEVADPSLGPVRLWGL